MTARCSLFLSGLLLLLPGWCVGCASWRLPLPPVATPSGRAEIVLHASAERVRVSIATQEAGDGATLVSQTEGRLVFAKQVSKPVSDVLDDFRPTGAPYALRIYTLAATTGGIRVTLHGELVRNYRTDREQVRALDDAATRRNEQRDLIRLRLALERR